MNHTYFPQRITYKTEHVGTTKLIRVIVYTIYIYICIYIYVYMSVYVYVCVFYTQKHYHALSVFSPWNKGEGIGPE
jgi:dolichyl-phosphate-mannose--protein O-mannosyl transferase